MNESLILILVIILACLCVWFLLRARTKRQKQLVCFDLERHPKNPLLAPDQKSYWESEATFNPAAIVDDEGRIHLLYRAIGSDGKSRLGYASSKDGLHFEERLEYPVFESFPGTDIPEATFGPQVYSPLLYTSGGGWSGCEDPRTVIIDNYVYMTYVAFGGWDSIRIAVTSISLSDFKRGRWNWKRPVLLSPPNVPSKNWVLFPEKINGKFAILHGIAPHIQIDYLESIDMLPKNTYIKSSSPSGGRDDFWDNWVRGAGPPPIKTKQGWLLLYHSMDKADPNKYKLGAMLLDLQNPELVLYRSPLPLLSPEMHYENDSKPGVVYASGAVVKDGILFVYYGGGDKHVCVAKAPLKKMLDWLIEHGKIST